MRNKVIGIILAIFSIILIFNINKLEAVGQVYQGVAYYENGSTTPHLIYRTLVRPHKSTATSFDYYNQWVYNKSDTGNSATDSYKSDEIIFTYDTIANYNTNPNKATYGYVTYNSIDNSVLLLSDMDDFEEWYGNVNSSFEEANVEDKFLFYSNEENDYYTDSDDMYYTGNIDDYNDNIIDVGTGSKTYPAVGFIYDTGNGARTLSRQTNVTVENVVAFKNYREMLYDSSKQEGDRVTSLLEDSLYVEDIFVENTVFEQLKVKANPDGDGKKFVYVSAISNTVSDNSTKFYMLTPSSFIHSKSYATKQSVMANYSYIYGEGITTYGWDPYTLGEWGDGWGSGLNLWDNKLVFQEASPTTKKIIVNHIYVDENGNKYFIDTEETSTLTANSSNKGITQKEEASAEYSEAYTVTKSEVNDKFVIKTLNQINADKDWAINGLNYNLTSKMYKVKDYTVHQTNSEASALLADDYYTVQSAGEKTITVNISNSTFSPETDFTVEPVDVNDDGTANVSKDSSVVVVNIYYEQPMKTITVQHQACKNIVDGACQDATGWTKLAGPGTAIVGVMPTAADEIDENYKETYKTFQNVESHYFILSQSETEDITEGTLSTLESAGGLEYIGHSYYKVATKVGGEGAAPYYTVAATDSDTDIIFKYKILDTYEPDDDDDDECNDNDDGNQPIIKYEHEYEYKNPPQKDVGGILTVSSINAIEATCDPLYSTLYSIPGNAIDNTDDVYAGVKNIPMYILAGVNVERLTHTDSKVTINIEISFGPNTSTWQIEVPYYYSYYAVQNILIQKLQYENIYNTASGYDTSGDQIFDITSKRIEPTDSLTSSLRLYGLDKNGDLSLNNRENWKEYIKTYYKASFSATKDLNRPDAELVSNPGDPVENSEKRNQPVSAYQGEEYFSPNYYNLVHQELEDSTLDFYIDTNNLTNAYKEIDLNGSVTITINLLSSDIFDKICSNWTEDEEGYVILAEADIATKKAKTEVAIENFENAKVNLGQAENSYASQCSSYGLGYTLCYDEAVETRDDYGSECSDVTCDISCSCSHCTDVPNTCSDPEETDCGFTTECEHTSDTCTGYGYGDCPGTEPCPTWDEWKSRVGVLSDLVSSYNTEKRAYQSALENMLNTFSEEEYALQNFDEAKYIQDNLWDVYKGYDEIKVAKLLGIDLYFDYASGGAILEDDNTSESANLITVKDDATYLISSVESTTAQCIDNATSALTNGVKITCSSDEASALGGKLRYNSNNEVVVDTVVLEASRPVLSDTQKTYYTDGIPGLSYIDDAEEYSSIRNLLKNSYKGDDNDPDNTFYIPKTVLNGKRVLAAMARYEVDKSKNNSGQYINLVGTATGVVNDNMYHQFSQTTTSNNDCEDSIITIKTIENRFIVSASARYTKDYGASENNSEEFNVYTPLIVDSAVNVDVEIIDQITNSTVGTEAYAIQANSPFTVSFTTNYDTVYSNDPDDFTSRYRFVYYIKYEFPVTAVTDGSRNLGAYDAMEWIGPIKGNSVQATPDINTITGGSITDNLFKYYVVAVAVNTKTSWTNQLLATINTSLADIPNGSALLNNLQNECGDEGGKKISYYADDTGDLVIVNRIYDFRVTDLKDVNWKNVFRNNEIASFVNQHSGIAYYAGISKWNTENPLKYNEIVGRTESEIGTTPTRILPLGPYKNTDTTYINAPKMGYRFSFDLKVTGNPQANVVSEDNANEKVVIEPTFYYISKNGGTYYREATSGNGYNGIYLFYKNSSGQYVRVRSTNDNYKIQFKPLDGYRALVQTDINNLNDNIITAGGLTKLTLKYSETTTYSENTAAITYYGEYKLPNSTIAVEVTNGKYDINKPLTNGYIGVVFNIYANDIVHVFGEEDKGQAVTLSYGKNAGGATNTSQWDYEGYLGITKPEQSYSTTLKLEKGTWNITDSIYQEIKGTVILYDLDNRASNDYN